MGISVKKIGETEGKPVYLYTLKNSGGMTVQASNYGCHILSIIVQGRDGTFADVALSPASLEGWLKQSGYFGSVVGRHGNRIEKGVFTMGGKDYRLFTNDRGNHLHGGKVGFDKKVWDGSCDEEKNAVTFTLHSPDGDEGYPGNLDVAVTYTLTGENELVLDYRAASDADTVLNLTNHSYFNLAGHDSGTVLNHTLQLCADFYTEVDENCIPTGVISSVAGTPFDFRRPKLIGRDIETENDQLLKAGGYDHNFVLSGPRDTLRLFAVLRDEDSGRVMEAYTDRPGVQFYAGNNLNGTIEGKGGHKYGRREGICLETQVFPNGMRHSHFPSPVLKKVEVLRTTTVYTFSVA